MSTDPVFPLLVLLTLQDLTSEPPDGLTIAEKLFVRWSGTSPIEYLREQSFCEQGITNPALVKPNPSVPPDISGNFLEVCFFVLLFRVFLGLFVFFPPLRQC